LGRLCIPRLRRAAPSKTNPNHTVLVPLGQLEHLLDRRVVGVLEANAVWSGCELDGPTIEYFRDRLAIHEHTYLRLLAGIRLGQKKHGGHRLLNLGQPGRAVGSNGHGTGGDGATAGRVSRLEQPMVDTGES
jgi:hypothetical protein